MKWPRWRITTGDPTDFLPIVIGGALLLLSLPGFVLVLLKPDQNAGILGTALAVWLGIGVVLGVGFLILGIRITAYPGSLAYRITHGRIFFR